jgi:hypothetical protein
MDLDLLVVDDGPAVTVLGEFGGWLWILAERE